MHPVSASISPARRRVLTYLLRLHSRRLCMWQVHPHLLLLSHRPAGPISVMPLAWPRPRRAASVEARLRSAVRTSAVTRWAGAGPQRRRAASCVSAPSAARRASAQVRMIIEDMPICACLHDDSCMTNPAPCTSDYRHRHSNAPLLSGSTALLWNGTLPITPPASVCSSSLSRCPARQCCSSDGFCISDPTVCGTGLCNGGASGKGEFTCKPTGPAAVQRYTFDVSSKA